MLPNALNQLIRIVSKSDTKTERLEVSLCSASVRQLLSNGFSEINNILIGPENRYREDAHLALMYSIRWLWQLIPRSVFEYPEPDYERSCQKRVLELFPNFTGDDDFIANLANITKRLKSYKKNDRSKVARFNINNLQIRKIFLNQNRKCNLCNFSFSVFGESLEWLERNTPHVHNQLEDEICLDVYYREPVLDHIIPYYIGGDFAANWQILCRTCNSGKSDYLSWIFKGWIPPRHPSELFQLNSQNRYAAIAKFKSETKVDTKLNSEVRLFIDNKDKMLNTDNLICKAL